MAKKQRRDSESSLLPSMMEPSNNAKEYKPVTDSVSTQDSTFGIGNWRPKSLQCLACLWGFVGLYSPCALWKVTIAQYTRSQITSIERHFRINSAKSGLILGSVDFGSICFSLIGSHFGKFAHIPRLLSLSAVVVGIAVISLSLVQIATPRNLPSGDDYKGLEAWKHLRHLCWNKEDLNHLNLSTTQLEKLLEGDYERNTEVPWTYFWMMFAMFVSGAMMSYKIPLQTYYVEQNVKEKRHSGKYIGVLVAAMVFGSPVALFLGGVMNEQPVDLKDTEMHTSDPRWISAWWLGYVLIGIFSVITSVPVFCLPRHIIYKDKDSDSDHKENHQSDTVTNSEIEIVQPSPDQPRKHLLGANEKIPDYTNGGKLGNPVEMQGDTMAMANGDIRSSPPDTSLEEKLKDWPRSLKRILCNRVVVLLMFEGFIFFTGLLGIMSFQLKYFENEFDKSASTVSFVLGFGQLFMAVTGTLAGGFITSRYNLSRASMFKITLITQFISVLLSGFFVILGCENHKIRGFNDFSSNITDLNCSCSNEKILFVCGSDGFNYLTPCIAGCREVSGLNYKNCSLIPWPSTAEPGFCDNGCKMFGPIIIIYAVLVFIATCGLAPRTLMAVRSVDVADQSLVVGLLNALVLRGAAIAGPVIFGRLYDSTCLLWPKDHGSCKLTDKDDLRYVFLGTGFLVRSVGVFFLFIATVLVHWEDKKGEHSDSIEFFVEKDDGDGTDFKDNKIGVENSDG